MSNPVPPGGSYNSDPHSQPASTKAKASATLFVIAIGVVAVIAFVFIDAIFAVIFIVIVAPIIGLGVGAFSGLFVGITALGHFFSWIVVPPIVTAGIFGALSGAVGAWLQRVFAVKNKLGKSFVSTLFSPEIWEGNATAFLFKLMVGAFAGYAVAAGLSSLGVFDPGATGIGPLVAIVTGSGGGGDFASEFFSWMVYLFIALAGLLVIGGIIGGGTGGIVGAIIGAGFSSIGTTAAIQGAAEGTVFRLFAPYRPKNLQSSRFIFFLVGAGKGAGEGIVVGAASGIVLAIARLAGMIS